MRRKNPDIVVVNDWIVGFANTDFSGEQWRDNLKSLIPYGVEREGIGMSAEPYTKKHIVDVLWPDLTQNEVQRIQERIQNAMENIAWRMDSKQAQWMFSIHARKRLMLKYDSSKDEFLYKAEIEQFKEFAPFPAYELGEFLVSGGHRYLGKCQICGDFFMSKRTRRKNVKPSAARRNCDKTGCKSKIESQRILQRRKELKDLESRSVSATG